MTEVIEQKPPEIALSPEVVAQVLAADLSLPESGVFAVLKLIAEGGTVPFIARYRKEATGSLDEVQIAAVRDGAERLLELVNRKNAILKSLHERALLTPALHKAVLEAASLTQVEDVYQPYKPKRRTKATVAKERGLEPLAQKIYAQTGCDPSSEAAAFVDAAKEVPDVEAALAGARDIIAEWISDDAGVREALRAMYQKEAVVDSAVLPSKEQEGAKFKDYFEFSEAASAIPSHRMLAVRRGEAEGVLRLRLRVDEERASDLVAALTVKSRGRDGAQVALAAADAFKRLLSVSLETEQRLHLKQRADETAIKVFAENLRQLLLAAPLGQKTVLALDPGFRTGCKVAIIDHSGKLLEHTAIFPHNGAGAKAEAATELQLLVKRFNVEAIAIGNGTASRETEAFVREQKLPPSVIIVSVDESGASIYSASDVARREFPDLDLTVRGAVSIARRLQDPLAELVKLDPKSIGVGQYQHDVDQGKLKQALDDVVMSCVNNVGVELNTASRELLAYVAGIGPTLAAAIVNYREAKGPFKSRQALREVPRLGPKAFEQAAGFLRIKGSEHPLDASAVHPERYALVDRMASDLGEPVAALVGKSDLQRRIDLNKYVTADVGLPTLRDILAELEKPGRDPRERFEAFAFAENVHSLADLRPGMKLPGIVTNITAFGCFVDIGVHQDGLVHISQLADKFVKDPSEVVKLRQAVEVTVLEVDIPRSRIALSLKSNAGAQAKPTGGKREEKSPPPRPKPQTGLGQALASALQERRR